MGDSRLNKIGSANEEDATIGGSTQYPGAHDSIYTSQQKGSPMDTRGSARGQKKKQMTARIQDNLNKKKFQTNKDADREKA